ncbi:hypothetical protein GCM10009639_54400 [Kitasatospora putterlickiae]|uniref:Uncharacterized protein n=1 Tax=Kitasatospora putterlickiae TaxID=221725 RepID=A0ABN1YDV4_9ACTN
MIVAVGFGMTLLLADGGVPTGAVRALHPGGIEWTESYGAYAHLHCAPRPRAGWAGMADEGVSGLPNRPAVRSGNRGGEAVV